MNEALSICGTKGLAGCNQGHFCQRPYVYFEGLFPGNDVNSSTFAPVELESVAFPERTANEFIDCLERTCPMADPYTQFAAFRHILSGAMRACLEKASRLRDSDSGNAIAILRLIDAWKYSSSGRPAAFLLSGFPVDPSASLAAPPTDGNYFRTSPPILTGKHGYITEWAMEAFAVLCGLEIVQNALLQQNLRYQRIVPQRGQQKVASGIGAEFFGMHTEATYRADNDLTLGLACLRNTQTPTLLASISDVTWQLEQVLTPAQLKLLELPVYRFLSGESFSSGNMQCTRPMLTRNLDGVVIEMQLNGNLDKVTVDDEQAIRHHCNHSELAALIGDVAQGLQLLNRGVLLGHGDLLILDNRRVVHSRSRIAPEDRVPGRERHLIRFTAKRDLQNNLHLSSRELI